MFGHCQHGSRSKLVRSQKWLFCYIISHSPTPYIFMNPQIKNANWLQNKKEVYVKTVLFLGRLFCFNRMITVKRLYDTHVCSSTVLKPGTKCIFTFQINLDASYRHVLSYAVPGYAIERSRIKTESNDRIKYLSTSSGMKMEENIIRNWNIGNIIYILSCYIATIELEFVIYVTGILF
jgi:hypothetical protein